MSKCYFKAKIRNSEIRSVKLVEHFMLMLMPTLCSATIKTDTNTHTFITLRHSLCTRVLKMKNINPKRTYRKRMLQFYKKKKTMHRWKKQPSPEEKKKKTHNIARRKKKHTPSPRKIAKRMCLHSAYQPKLKKKFTTENIFQIWTCFELNTIFMFKYGDS